MSSRAERTFLGELLAAPVALGAIILWCSVLALLGH